MNTKIRKFSICTLMIVGVAASVASSPPGDDELFGDVGFIVKNSYAESIFSASYSITDEVTDDSRFKGSPEGEILADVRLDLGQESEVLDVFSAPAGTAFTVNMVGRSLGEDNEFTIEESVPDESFGPVECTLDYKYDIANATFSVGHECRAR